MKASLLLAVCACAALVSACDSPLGDSSNCDAGIQWAPNTTVNGSVSEADCTRDNHSGDFYVFTSTGQTATRLSMQATGFAPELTVYAGTPTAMGEASLIFQVVTTPATNDLYVPPGSYFIVAGTADNRGGNYTLTSQPIPATGCPPRYSYGVPGLVVTGTITTNDCQGGGISRQDIIEFYLKPGQVLRARLVADKKAAVSIAQGDGSVIDKFIDASGVAEVSYTATKRDFYRVHVHGEPSFFGTTNYTLTVQ